MGRQEAGREKAPGGGRREEEYLDLGQKSGNSDKILLNAYVLHPAIIPQDGKGQCLQKGVE